MELKKFHLGEHPNHTIHTHSSMGQNRVQKKTRIGSTDLQLRCQSNPVREGTSFKQMVLEQIDVHKEENSS